MSVNEPIPAIFLGESVSIGRVLYNSDGTVSMKPLGKVFGSFRRAFGGGLDKIKSVDLPFYDLIKGTTNAKVRVFFQDLKGVKYHSLVDNVVYRERDNLRFERDYLFDELLKVKLKLAGLSNKDRMIEMMKHEFDNYRKMIMPQVMGLPQANLLGGRR